MAHGTLREFDANKESIEDFHQRFEFYCLANNVKEGDEAQRNRKKALFITLVGLSRQNRSGRTNFGKNFC